MVDTPEEWFFDNKEEKRKEEAKVETINIEKTMTYLDSRPWEEELRNIDLVKKRNLKKVEEEYWRNPRGILEAGRLGLQEAKSAEEVVRAIHKAVHTHHIDYNRAPKYLFIDRRSLALIFQYARNVTFQEDKKKTFFMGMETITVVEDDCFIWVS